VIAAAGVYGITNGPRQVAGGAVLQQEVGD